MKEFVNHVLGYFGLQVTEVAGAAVQAAVPAAQAAFVRCIEDDKSKLIDMLNHGDYRFRTLARLAKGVNSDDLEYVKGLLRSVGARAAHRDETKWGLKTIVGDRPAPRGSY